MVYSIYGICQSIDTGGGVGGSGSLIVVKNKVFRKSSTT